MARQYWVNRGDAARGKSLNSRIWTRPAAAIDFWQVFCPVSFSCGLQSGGVPEFLNPAAEGGI